MSTLPPNPLVDLLRKCEMLLTMHDCSKGWLTERDLLLRELRAVIVNAPETSDDREQFRSASSGLRTGLEPAKIQMKSVTSELLTYPENTRGKSGEPADGVRTKTCPLF